MTRAELENKMAVLLGGRAAELLIFVSTGPVKDVTMGSYLDGVSVTAVPEPAYRWRDEVQAQREIVRFLRDDREISRTWQRLINEGQQRGASFDELAGRIDDAVGDRYDESFEQLAQLPGGSALPSAATVERLRDYAQARRDASRELADGLRAHDAAQIRAALEKARRARQPAPGVPEKR